MKLSRVLAASAGVALVGASTLAFVAPASAEVIIPPAAPFPAETSPYAADWFTGGGSVGTSSTDAQFGLNIAAGPLVTDTYQVLNGTPVTGDLTELVDAASMFVTRGTATLQIPVFGEPGAADQQFTTLRPATPSAPGGAYFPANAPWITSRALPGFAAGSTATLAQFETALSTGVGYQILGFGAAVGNGQSGSIGSITFAGDTHQFRDTATGEYVPKTVTVTELATTGVSLELTGFAPLEPLYIYLTTEGGDGDAINDTEYAADADGNFVQTITATGWEPGTYLLTIDGAFSGDGLFGDLTILADPAAVPAPAAVAPPVLAATGTDLSGGILAGGVLLLAGAGLALVATRRRFGSQA